MMEDLLPKLPSEEIRFTSNWIFSCFELIQTCPAIDSQSVRSALADIQCRLQPQTRASLAHLLGVNWTIINKWLIHAKRMQFTACLKICTRLQISFAGLLSRTMHKSLITSVGIRRSSKPLRSRGREVYVRRVELMRMLDIEARASEPLSITQLAHNYNVGIDSLIRLNRPACQAIVAIRKKEQFRKTSLQINRRTALVVKLCRRLKDRGIIPTFNSVKAEMVSRYAYAERLAVGCSYFHSKLRREIGHIIDVNMGDCSPKPAI
jgi:hypothetical protein